MSDELVTRLLSPPPQRPGDKAALLGLVRRATDRAADAQGGGLCTSALSEFYGKAFSAPASTAMEESVPRWMASEVCGLPAGSAGLLTTGGALSTLSAVIAARQHHLGEDITH